jgi:uncharacterized protein YjbI with pentapeptide repeats
MEDLLHINKTFEKVIAIGGSIRHKEFEGCIFRQCDFSNADLSNMMAPKTASSSSLD